MRKTSKPPSEWLNLLCREWANENQVLVETTDAKFLDYKPYLKGLISSQLLCRLSIPPTHPTILPDTSTATTTTTAGGTPTANTNTNTTGYSNDFWEILGVSDSFDRSYIVAQVRHRSTCPLALVYDVSTYNHSLLSCVPDRAILFVV